MIRTIYVETNTELSGVRMGVSPNRNIIRNKVIYDIAYGQDTNSYGIFCERTCNYNKFSNNIIYKIGNTCAIDGGWWVELAQNNKWYNNTIYDCGKTGLLLGNSKNSEFRNNIIMKAGIAEITVCDKSVQNGGNLFSNNLYYNTSRAQIGVWNSAPNQPPYNNNHPANLTLSQWNAASGEQNSFSGDPKFVNASGADFHLQSSSPAIDKGMTLSTVTTDFEGTTRPQGPAYDIGADEFG